MGAGLTRDNAGILDKPIFQLNFGDGKMKHKWRQFYDDLILYSKFIEHKMPSLLRLHAKKIKRN